MIASHLPYPPLEVLVAGGDDVALVLGDPLDEAVVRVRPRGLSSVSFPFGNRRWVGVSFAINI